MFIERNCFERQTDNLGNTSIRSQILTLYNISHLIANHQYQIALQQIESHKQTLDFDDHSLKFQFKFMQAFCFFQLHNLQKTCSICKQIYIDLHQEQKSILQKSYNSDTSKIGLYQELMRSFSVRFYTFLINLYTRGVSLNIDPKQLLHRLIQILKVDNFVYLQQVLGSLTGCKNFTGVKKAKAIHGQQNKKKAIKLQILANWKYLVGEKKQCIKFKRQALAIWRQQNSLKEKQKCEIELKQLLPNQSQKGKFIQKLQKLQFFIVQLSKLQDVVKQKPKPLQIKWCFPALISDLYMQQDQKKIVDNKNLSQSKYTKVNQKKSQLTNVIQKCQLFYAQYKQQRNSEITSLIYNSKFIDEKTKQIRKKLLILFKIRVYAFRLSFPYIIKCANQRQKLLKKKN